MVVVVEKFRFRIRTRDGMLVESLQIPARDLADAERKLRQIYRDCVILWDGDRSQVALRSAPQVQLASPVVPAANDAVDSSEHAAADPAQSSASDMAFEDIVGLIGLSVGGCALPRTGRR